MLKQVTVRNFQSCKNTKIPDIRHITMLHGKNNSGKSSILKALYLPVLPTINAQKINWGKMGGNQVYYHSFTECVTDKDTTKSIEIDYSFYFPKVHKETFKEIQQISPYNEYKQPKSLTYKLEIKETTIHEALNSDQGQLYTQDSSNVIKPDEEKIRYGGSLATQDWRFDDVHVPGRQLGILRNYVMDKVKRIHFLSVERRPRMWVDLPKLHDRIGVRGEYVVSLMNYLRNSNEALYHDIRRGICSLSPGYSETYSPMKPDGTVNLSHLDQNQLEVNTLMAGTGINQTIPIIVQLKYSKPGDIILIEEPELSLYPEAQELLVDIMIEESLKGKQIFFTTHSDTIPFRLQNALGKRELSTDRVVCYEVEKKNGYTTAEKQTLDESMDILRYPKN